MRCSRHNKLPSHSFFGAKFFKLSLSSRSAPTSWELLSLIVSVGCPLIAKNRLSAGRIIYTQLQVYSSRVHAGKDYSIMLGGCVSAYLHFVRSKVVTCCVMKWGVNGSRGVLDRSARSCVSVLASISLQHTHRNFTDLAKSWALMIQDFVLISATVVATSVCPIWWKRYQKRYPVVSGEHRGVFGFIGNEGFIYSTTNSDYSIFVCKRV